MNPEKITREFFKKMGFDVKVDSEKKDETLFLKVKTKEPKTLIGKRGFVLRSIQRLLRIMILKNLDEDIFVQLDINEYKRKKKEYLEEVAGEIADKVSLSGEAKALPSMNAYERRIVHIALSERADVETESEGDEPERKVVVKPT